MKLDITWQKVTTFLGVPAALATAILSWGYVGWETPVSHTADLEQQATVQESVSSAILIQLKSNRDEWWCDEEAEGLDNMLADKDGGDDSAALEQDIMEQRVKMEATQCHRFDKD